MLSNLILTLIGYLLGSISSAILVTRALDLKNPLEHGSLNPGATNMMRVNGKKAAALTLLGDMLKGIIPVFLAKAMGADFNVQLLVAFAAFFGHLYPVFFNFKGGKGIATALGVLFGLDWVVGLLAILTWLAVYKWKKVSSIAGISSTIAFPILIILFSSSTKFLIFGLAIATIIVWRHRSNIEKLLSGKELKITPTQKV